MKVKLSKAAIQLREQIDDSFPDRDRTSDGWIGDNRHSNRVSDHNPDVEGWVRAIDVDRDLFKGSKPDIMPDLADQLVDATRAPGDRGGVSPAVGRRPAGRPGAGVDAAGGAGGGGHDGAADRTAGGFIVPLRASGSHGGRAGLRGDRPEWRAGGRGGGGPGGRTTARQ